MTLVATTLDELLALAEKATPGPWVQDEWDVFGPTLDDGSDHYLVHGSSTKHDLVYLAALSPERVKALVEVAVAARAAELANRVHGEHFLGGLRAALTRLDREMER